MRKPKVKRTSRKKKTAAPGKQKPTPLLKERLEAEFAQAVKSAKSYVDDPQRLPALSQHAPAKDDDGNESQTPKRDTQRLTSLSMRDEECPLGAADMDVRGPPR